MSAAIDLVALEKKLAKLTTQDLIALRWRLLWKAQARPKQLMPSGDWVTWGILSGRGFGKSLAGAHAILELALDHPGCFCGVIAPTHGDLRHVNFEGPVGMTTILPQELISSYNASASIITLYNGSVIRGFSATEPARLRGPQHHFVWTDELAAWQYAREAWDMMQFGLRLGKHTRCIWTTTPKPVPIIRSRIMEESPKHIVTRGTTFENRANLSTTFYEELAKYEGTSIGRQELYGEMLNPEDAGHIRRAQWKIWPALQPLPVFKFVVMSLDTAFTEKTFDKKEQQGDPTACSVWGLFEHEARMHVLLLDSWEKHLGFPELVATVKKERTATYGLADPTQTEGRAPLYGVPLFGATKSLGRAIDLILIEDKGSGISLRQALAAEDVLTTPYNPGRMDKLARLHAVSPAFAHGRVWAVESNNRSGEFRSWAEPLVMQVCTFVGQGSVEHDDLLDTTTQALKYLMDRFMGAFTIPEKTKEQKMKEEAESKVRRMESAYG